MRLSKLDDREPFATLDRSTIREIAGPAWTPASSYEHTVLVEVQASSG